MVNILFRGKPKPSGGLTNEDELKSACPEEFIKWNDWSKYSQKIYHGKLPDTFKWKWKIKDASKKMNQFDHFIAVLKSPDLTYEAKLSISGWMLSEMLKKVPKYKE
jgi:hypothetical protein